jgi:hypothetical protein
MQSKQDGRDDFDFFIGRWKGRNRRLRERLKNCDEWEEFEGRVIDRKILGGMGNMDEVSFHRESGLMEGITLSLFDPQSQEWSVYGASSAGGMLEPPLIGKFENERGVFYSHDVYENQHVFVRVIWSEITETSCRWEQAFSIDGGKNWETNWVAELTRLG